jgi:hypothetical protein
LRLGRCAPRQRQQRSGQQELAAFEHQLSSFELA